MIDDEHLTVPLPMSREQLANLVRGDIQRMHDDDGLASWLPEVAADIHNVEVGIWRCAQGGDDSLWESPFDWRPECVCCGCKAFLVEVVGCFDFSVYV
jgi:hypothetical protein